MNVRAIADLSPDERTALFERDAGIDDARSDAREIVERVRTEGDVALREYAEEFDGVAVGNVDLADEAERAWDRLDEDVRTAIEDAIENVWAFHERQLPEDWTETFEGRELGRRFRPIERAGVYVPGGTAAYPSSAIMGIVPADVAGVEQIAVATPPAEEPSDATLGAIHAAGADRVYAAGGAQAIGALAYGTETVDRVQKIVGPGNRWVSAAKAEVQGDVEIDFVAGPSEVLVLADGSADPGFVAAELVAQAEHDPNAAVVAVTADEDLAEAVAEAVEEQVAAGAGPAAAGAEGDDRDRTETIEAALENDASGVLLARSEPEAVAVAEEFAPEHLAIYADDPEAIADRIPSAGSVFLGEYTPVAAGDYASGTNHVLPTNGLARVTGGLSVDTFLRASTVQRLDRESLEALRDTIETLAEAEGLDAHAESVRKRFEE
ncbi:histidinol dehydrogenase [Salinarchaeum chitinilyticum]